MTSAVLWDFQETKLNMTDTAMFGGFAVENKGCCSGSKLGIFDWRALSKHKAYSNPGWYLLR